MILVFVMLAEVRMCGTKRGYNSKKQHKRLVFVKPSPHDVFQRNCCDSHHYFIMNLFNSETTRTLQPCSPTLMCCNIHAAPPTFMSLTVAPQTGS